MTEEEHLDKIEQLSKQTNEYVIEYDNPLIPGWTSYKYHNQVQALTEAEYNARLGIGYDRGIQGIGVGMTAGIGGYSPWGY